jgi:hypothetical protein
LIRVSRDEGSPDEATERLLAFMLVCGFVPPWLVLVCPRAFSVKFGAVLTTVVFFENLTNVSLVFGIVIFGLGFLTAEGRAYVCSQAFSVKFGALGVEVMSIFFDDLTKVCV